MDTIRAIRSFSRAKSPWILHLPSGGCNGCDIEVLACTGPRYDIERFGCLVRQNPRFADIVIVTGAVPCHLKSSLKRTVEKVPDPKIVIALGDCACTGGIFSGRNYSIRTPLGSILPVDLYVPGCPPRPDAILSGIIRSVALLREKSL